MRLLYVGLTRARDALWVCGGALAANTNTALHRLLGGNLPRAALVQSLAGQLQTTEGLPPADSECLQPLPPAAVPAPRIPRRQLRRDWWIHSFSQLHRQRPHGKQAMREEAPADDERPLATVDAARVRFGGTRFGNALHQALEHVDFTRWRDADGAVVPDGEADYLAKALRDQDYAESDIDDGVRELAPLIAGTLNAPLACADGEPPVRLCDVRPAARVVELEFHFTLADADSHALLALLQAHGIANDRRDFGVWPRLSGLMNGKIDLTYIVAGRTYVLDYKSNRLPDYDAATLQQAMGASEYDLQALLYVVAVHRWLRLRRGVGYDYARDFGGVRYLFCRALDADAPGRGVVALRFPAELVTGVDALFAPDGGRT